MRTRATFRARPVTPMKLARRASTLSILSIAAALVVTNLTPIVGTSASWNDSEWDNSAVGTLSCADDGNFQTRGAGRLLGGGLLPLDLDDAVAIKGMTVTNNGERPLPSSDVSPHDGAYANPLDLSVLNSIKLPGLVEDSRKSLATVLSLTPNSPNNVGVINQFARAESSGLSQGASGAVSNSGAILTENGDNEMPKFGTISLSGLVNELTGHAVGDIVSGIADLKLEIGAISSQAELHACDAAWTGDIDSNLTRKYLVAGVDATIDAPIVGELSDTITTLVNALPSTLNAVIGEQGVLDTLTGGITSLLGAVTSLVSVGDVEIAGPTISVDLSGTVQRLLATTIEDENNTLSLNLGTGQVRVDLTSLLGQEYGETGVDGTPLHGLNELSPNTELVLNANVTKKLTDALTAALNDWRTDVLKAVENAILDATVTASVTLILDAGSLGEIASVEITVNQPLKKLLAGNTAVDVDLVVLGAKCNSPIDVLPCLVKKLLDPITGPIVNGLIGGAGKIVGDAVNGAIFRDPGPIATLTTSLTSGTNGVFTALSTVVGDFLGVDGVVSLRVNVQNDPAVGNRPAPDPPGSYPLYPDWETGTMAVPDDQYDVAALSIGILNALGTRNNVNLELARSSVGVSCAVGDHDSRCAAY